MTCEKTVASLLWFRGTLASNAANARLRSDPLPVLALDPSDFDLAHCRRAMAGVRDMLERGPAFAIVDRLPLERIARVEAVSLFWLLSSLVARPVAQWAGRIWLRDRGRRSYHG